jgi:hypothetical protein
MRPYDSTVTRVTPVFRAIHKELTTPDGLLRLLSLPEIEGVSPTMLADPGTAEVIEFDSAETGMKERALQPPASLLQWLVQNLVQPDGPIVQSAETAEKRQKLIDGDEASIQEGLKLLSEGPKARSWYVLEGPTYPDVYIQTSTALIVIEGKRTEAGPTTHTTWMKNRHQMLRHLDCAWEILQGRDLYGFFIVEGEDESGSVPGDWKAACKETNSQSAIDGSLPHRSATDKKSISGAFLGATTWQRVCCDFGVERELPHRADEDQSGASSSGR